MTKEERVKVYVALAAPFPENAIERTDGRVTGRGYSTTGLKCQYIVNRMNEILGVGGFRVSRKVTVKEITTAKGRPAFDATCEVLLQLGEWKDGVFVPFAEVLADGCHTATTVGDATKGSYSNGIKKAAALAGCGRQAYEGTLDDDNVPTDPSRELQKAPAAPRPHAPALQPAAPASPPRAMHRNDQGEGVKPDAQGRTRLSTRQLTTILNLARQLGYDATDFRAEVLGQHGVALEYLQRGEASQLIGDLIARVGRNGNGRDAGGPGLFHGRAPGQEG